MALSVADIMERDPVPCPGRHRRDGAARDARPRAPRRPGGQRGRPLRRDHHRGRSRDAPTRRPTCTCRTTSSCSAVSSSSSRCKHFEERLRKAIAATAADLMTEDPITIEPGAPSREAARLIADSDAQPPAGGRARSARRRRHPPRRARRARRRSSSRRAAGARPGRPRRDRAQLHAPGAPSRRRRALCAVVKADGYGHGAVPAARAALAGGASGWRSPRPRRRPSCAPRASRRRCWSWARCRRRGARGGAGAPRADVVAWREEFVGGPLAGARDRRPRQARHRHGPARHARPRRGARRRPRGRGRAGLRLAGAMTHFATADDDPAFVREQLTRFAPWAEAVRAIEPDVLVHAANSAADAARARRRASTWSAAASRSTGWTRSSATRAAHGLEPALSLRSYVAEVKRCAPGESAGYGRRFVAERADLARHAADRLRRRRAARADQQRRRADRRAPVPARRHGLDGQHHRRPRARHARGAARARRPC